VNPGANDARQRVAQFVSDAQAQMCEAFQRLEPERRFTIDDWGAARGERLGGSGSTRVIANGVTFEKGGVNTSVVTGAQLPSSVLTQRPELKGHGFFAA
jgi:coproporphyrinogen III oxidase